MRALLLILTAFFLSAFASAQDAPKYKVVPTYPMTTCIVTGEELDAEPLSFEAGGRTFKVCCEKCQAKVEKDPAPFAAKLDAAIVAAQLPHYPLDVCAVAGKKLGSMGDPVKLVLNDTLVQLCCGGCTKKAMANPAAMAAKVMDASYAMQLKAYPTTKCVVSGEELGDKVTETMVGTCLFRTCCAKCAAKVAADPKKYMDKLYPAHGKDAAGAKEDKGSAQPAAAPAAKPAEKGSKGGAMAGDCGDTCIDGATGACCAAEGKAAPAKATGGSCCADKAAPAKAGAKATGGSCCADKAAPAKDAKASGECCGDKAAPAAKPAPKAEPVKS
ncbi:MAG: hypothetical protein RL148_2023 [Planctomycetota bacterium]